MSLHTLLLKFIEGITDASTRADIVSTFSVLTEAYRAGRIDDQTLKKALKELCLDVLTEKHPTTDIELLKSEAEGWAEKFYRAIRAKTMRERYGAILPPE